MNTDDYTDLDDFTEGALEEKGEPSADDSQIISLARFREERKRDKVVVPEVSRPVDARGELTGTGDPELDGEVDGALDLITRLGKSERVRQSMIRHAFRYWMGRNETLSDSPTLMAMDKAYTTCDGSFNELLVALLTSDSFLLRKDRP